MSNGTGSSQHKAGKREAFAQTLESLRPTPVDNIVPEYPYDARTDRNKMFWDNHYRSHFYRDALTELYGNPKGKYRGKYLYDVWTTNYKGQFFAIYGQKDKGTIIEAGGDALYDKDGNLDPTDRQKEIIKEFMDNHVEGVRRVVEREGVQPVLWRGSTDSGGFGAGWEAPYPEEWGLPVKMRSPEGLVMDKTNGDKQYGVYKDTKGGIWEVAHMPDLDVMSAVKQTKKRTKWFKDDELPHGVPIANYVSGLDALRFGKLSKYREALMGHDVELLTKVFGEPTGKWKSWEDKTIWFVDFDHNQFVVYSGKDKGTLIELVTNKTGISEQKKSLAIKFYEEFGKKALALK